MYRILSVLGMLGALFFSLYAIKHFYSETFVALGVCIMVFGFSVAMEYRAGRILECLKVLAVVPACLGAIAGACFLVYVLAGGS